MIASSKLRPSPVLREAAKLDTSRGPSKYWVFFYSPGKVWRCFRPLWHKWPIPCLITIQNMRSKANTNAGTESLSPIIISKSLQMFCAFHPKLLGGGSPGYLWFCCEIQRPQARHWLRRPRPLPQSPVSANHIASRGEDPQRYKLVLHDQTDTKAINPWRFQIKL